MKIKSRLKLSDVMIIIGAVMIITFAVYEGATYPWKPLFASWGWGQLATSPTQLPEPAKLPPSANLVSVERVDPAAAQGEIPAQPNFFRMRPPMDITKLGVIKIPRLQLSENIVMGTGDELLYGVGHINSTAMPGEEGNCVLAGHRNYVVMRPFRYLDKMQVSDQVFITDNANTYTYEVFEIFVITPDDAWAIKPQEQESHMLTLLTCTPVMTYTDRLIVWCRLTNTAAISS